MEESELKELLERYWLAETTIEEEKLVEKYMVLEHSTNSFKNLFLARHYAKSVSNPAADTERWSYVRKAQNNNYAWILKLAAILFVIISLATTMLLIKQKQQRMLEKAAQEQLKADLTLMFNTVNDNYVDINTTINQ